ncbi:MAG TPA: glycosyltransferase, partial [Nitrolancea sp.]
VALMLLGLRMARAYSSLLVRMVRRIDHADIVMFGYIGQLDVLLLGPLVRWFGKTVIFNPLITLTDTLIEDRETFARGGLMERLIRLIDRMALSLANVILVDTAENGAYLTEQFGITPERIHVIPVGADESLFTAACRSTDSNHLVRESPRSRPGCVPPHSSAGHGGIPLPGQNQSEHGKSVLSVLFYGNMIPLQGVETIVRAARLLRDEGVRFEIIGHGQTLGAARALADDIGATNIEWLGRVPYAELPRRIARADIVLGIFGNTAKAGRVVPNKVYQAMAMGAAIVTRDSSAQQAMLTDGVSALLVPPADPAALADAIRRLRDPDLRQRLGRAVRESFVERASIDMQAGRLRSALSPVVEAAMKRHAGSVSA